MLTDLDLLDEIELHVQVARRADEHGVIEVEPEAIVRIAEPMP